jgi:hypothetical protein
LLGSNLVDKISTSRKIRVSAYLFRRVRFGLNSISIMKNFFLYRICLAIFEKYLTSDVNLIPLEPIIGVSNL